MRAWLAILALGTIILPQSGGATSVRPVPYGPWGMLCLPGDNQSLICRIRYQSGENEVQWEAALQTDGARILTWGRNKSNCREAQVTERVERNYRPAQPNLEDAEIRAFAGNILRVMRSHTDFFGDCYNERGRTEAVAPSILDAASSDFVRAVVAAEGYLRIYALRAEAAV